MSWITPNQDYTLHRIKENAKGEKHEGRVLGEVDRIYQAKDWAAMKVLIGAFKAKGMQGVLNHLLLKNDQHGQQD